MDAVDISLAFGAVITLPADTFEITKAQPVQQKYDCGH